MSKYSPLLSYVQNMDIDTFILTYDDIEKITGFKIDHSFLNFKKELLNYGYKVKKISMKEQTILFEKII